MSVRGGDKGGELLTRPIMFGDLAERLVFNFQTADGGSLRVGLETEDGQPIPGYRLTDCLPLEGDSIRENVKWKDGADISALRGKTVRLRFQLEKADLYSIQFQPWLR